MRAHGVDDGDGAVGHGVQLVQAAGLEARGHEQDVAAGRDAVGHGHAEPHPPPALLVPRRLHAPASSPPIQSAPLLAPESLCASSCPSFFWLSHVSHDLCAVENPRLLRSSHVWHPEFGSTNWVRKLQDRLGQETIDACFEQLPDLTRPGAASKLAVWEIQTRSCCNMLSAQTTRANRLNLDLNRVPNT